MLMASWLPKELTPIMPECPWFPARDVSWLGLRGTLYKASAISAARFKMMSCLGARDQSTSCCSERSLSEHKVSGMPLAGDAGYWSPSISGKGCCTILSGSSRGDGRAEKKDFQGPNSQRGKEFGPGKSQVRILPQYGRTLGEEHYWVSFSR